MRIILPIKKVFFLITAILFTTSSLSADLATIYSLAEKNDPNYQQNISTHHAILESKPQARSQLLPSLDITANTKRNAQDITTSGSSIGSDGEIDFNSHGYSLNLSQPLFRRDRFIASVLQGINAAFTHQQHLLESIGVFNLTSR